MAKTIYTADQLKSIYGNPGAEVEIQQQTIQPIVAEKVADFTGGKELAQGLGQALAQRGSQKVLNQTLTDALKQQNELLVQRQKAKELGEDTSTIDRALASNKQNLDQIGQGAEALLNPAGLTEKQVIGDALQLATTAGGAKVAGAVAGRATQATGIGAGLIQGAKTGTQAGAAVGGLTGISQGLQEDKTAGEIAQEGLTGAVLGGVTGGILGGLTGALSGGLKGRALRRAVLDNKISSGDILPGGGGGGAFTGANKVKVVREKAVQIAKQQGIDDTDIEFINSMKSPDRVKAQKMVELAQKASTDKRSLERPIDVVGDSMVERIKFIQGQNKKSGQAVNEVAKTLRGKAVDATPISQQADSLIDDLGIMRGPEGRLDFSNSVFKNTPTLQKKLAKFLNEVPTGQADAYDVHIFKKSIDELVDYGVQGEGLKGNSQRILKSLRATADDVLDNTFEEYNKANTDFRITKEVLDEVDSLFGKKVGVGKERGGQLLRSVFSNNTQRPRVLSLVDALENTSKAYGKQFDDNLIDQALFSEILEDIYGTQATTSLQGQTARAIRGTQKVMAGLRDPLKGAGELIATGAEKSLGISAENKKKVLSALLRQ